MKTVFTFIACLLITTTVLGQDRYLTKNGKINFFSKAEMEDISADNEQVLSIIDTKTGKMAISILMKSFMFEKALMQEHFNENYVESDKYPKATFKGNIIDFNTISEKESAKTVKGTLKIHGVEKETSIDANFKKVDDTILVSGNFMVNLEDFNVKIPAVVSKNIAKEIKVTFNFNHKLYKK